MEQTNTQANFDRLSQDEQILITASSKLVKHFRGLEAANLLSYEETSELVGCVKKIVAIAKSRAVEDRVEKIDGELKK